MSHPSNQMIRSEIFGVLYNRQEGDDEGQVQNPFKEVVSPVKVVSYGLTKDVAEGFYF